MVTVQEGFLRRGHVPCNTHASSACTAAPLDYKLINNIIFQQHRREACVPLTHKQQEPMRSIVRSPSASLFEVTPRSGLLCSGPVTPLGSTAHISSIRLLKFETS